MGDVTPVASPSRGNAPDIVGSPWLEEPVILAEPAPEISPAEPELDHEEDVDA